MQAPLSSEPPTAVPASGNKRNISYTSNPMVEKTPAASDPPGMFDWLFPKKPLSSTPGPASGGRRRRVKKTQRKRKAMKTRKHKGRH